MLIAARDQVVVGEPEGAQDSLVERAVRLVRDDSAAKAKRMNVAPVTGACQR